MAICLVLGACSEDLPKAEQDRYIAELESKVSLPEGAGSLGCYRRQYTFQDGADDTEGPVLIGYYSLADREHLQGTPPVSPGIYIRERGFKIGVLDQGCGLLVVRYPLTHPEQTVRAQCYPDISGDSPQSVVPPVEC